MSTFAHKLKAEISRLAKKEIRAETQALKKATGQYRSEIASLKRRLAGLEAQIKKLGKSSARAAVAVDAADETKLRFRAGGFASLRKKLGLSAADMGQLLGVSAQSVYHWESGKARPRASQLQAIAAMRKLGRRAVAAQLAQAEESAEAA